MLYLIFSGCHTQYTLPSVVKCSKLPNTVVRVTNLCELRKCYRDAITLCNVFNGIKLCDCKNGYFFNHCNGQCVKREDCPKVIGRKPACKQPKQLFGK